MKKLRKVLCLFMALSMLTAGCSAPPDKGMLKVGVREDIMGLGYLNPTTGEYYGLEIDLAKKLAENLGYAGTEFVTVSPENRKEILLNGQVDCLISAYSISESRLKNFDFSPAYYSDHTCIMVEKSAMISGIEDLVGKRIGVLKGADAAPELSEKMIGMGLFTAEDTKGSSLEYFESYDDLSVALEEGTVDAACMDGVIAKAHMKADRVILDDVIAPEDYGVATQKGSDLSQPVAEAIQNMLDDGTITKIIDKWN